MDDAEREDLQRWLMPRLVEAWDSGSSQTFDVSGGRFVQWAGYPAGLQVECVSNRFLPEVEHLSGAEIDQLRAAGWQDPLGDDLPNHWQRFVDRSGVPTAAEALARAVAVLRGSDALSAEGAPGQQQDAVAGEGAGAPPHSFASDIDGVRRVIVLPGKGNMNGWSVETTGGRSRFEQETVWIAGSPNLIGIGARAPAWTAVCQHGEELIRFLPPQA